MAEQQQASAAPKDAMSFWEHLDVLRGALFRIATVTVLFAVVAFFLKEPLFDIVLAPRSSSFVIYRLFDRLALLSGADADIFSVHLINTGLAQQFMIHVKMALCAGVILASPYILYQLFRFVSPALYANERRYATHTVGAGYAMFLLGMLLGYYLIFPLTFRFLGTYQVSADVPNLITLDSYISTLLLICLSMGIVFEIPVLSWLLARMGLLSAAYMRRYRRHAVVIILVLAAIITPTSDVLTLLAVSLPMWLLYEFSILLVARTRQKTA